ncbi:MAG: transporter ATP-binding protein [Pseudonocardiales bacterium]|nr:transporter ATP-binding protein [Jatrophihabitantaceae bacterium]MCW2604362.1 transporter ATP-binding protein [Pseudonocardiales bacterium]
MTAAHGVISLEGTSMAFGARTLWTGLDFELQAGEFVAVLGVNGSGKTTLLQTILGLTSPTSGRVLVAGSPARRGSRALGYIPQQRRIAPPAPLRARDLVGVGVDGQRFGLGSLRARRARRATVEAALDGVGALHLADTPLDVMSGGEQQRVRVAQALVTDPQALLCDEPLLSLDLHHQQTTVALIDGRRRSHGTAVLFVTHEINPVLPYVDRVLYLAGGRFHIGAVDEVLTSENLTALYGTPVEVIRVGGRIIVAGLPEHSGPAHAEEGLDPGADPDSSTASDR